MAKDLQRVRFPARHSFHTDLARRVEQYFQGTGGSRHGGWMIRARNAPVLPPPADPPTPLVFRSLPVREAALLRRPPRVVRPTRRHSPPSTPPASSQLAASAAASSRRHAGERCWLHCPERRSSSAGRSCCRPSFIRRGSWCCSGLSRFLRSATCSPPSSNSRTAWARPSSL